jgi:hypothetical protein
MTNTTRPALPECVQQLDEAYPGMAVADAVRAYADECTAAAQARIVDLEALVRAAKPIVDEYAIRNPRWESDNGWQDPNGAHAWLARAALASTSGAPNA